MSDYLFSSIAFLQMRNNSIKLVTVQFNIFQEGKLQRPQMKWVTLIPTTIATLVAVAGWIVAYKFNSARDIKNKQREIRVKHLAEIYDVLLELGRNVDILGNYQEVEKAVSYIHLYGNAKQVSLCESFVRDLTETGGANQTKLVVEIRNSIREELGLEILSTKLNLLKITPKAKSSDKDRNYI